LADVAFDSLRRLPKAFAPKFESIILSFTFDDASRTAFGMGPEDFPGVRRRLAVQASVAVAVIIFGSFGEAQFTYFPFSLCSNRKEIRISV
jgi:hypothetical protein